MSLARFVVMLAAVLAFVICAGLAGAVIGSAVAGSDTPAGDLNIERIEVDGRTVTCLVLIPGGRPPAGLSCDWSSTSEPA